ncbi:cation-translocating P-type ATPase [Desulfolutivibrio sulfoxidireducens]|uniref:cation-translocating P-type ATPase n=1 Tax=Desulfolutivibrio sulfoxidireducens TaxID=2773299 RepID=UPI00159E31B6|nr:cation-translocating P-type ATPase [Desulfolutivibrio sulfoxidireducens]QLA15021.1 HAD-IC family P-type ATPase [Desulfolutivibrio sulfoxidireducens]
MDHDWHALSPGDVLEKFGTDPALGLDPAEAASRLEKHGPNELVREEGVSPWALFFGQFTNILIAILVAAIILSALVGEVVDAVIIAVIVVFCAVLGFVQEYRAEKALAALRKMLAPTSTVFRGGREERIDSREIVPGDLLVLEAGDKIAADARVVRAHALRCDEAPLTGESVPVGKSTEALAPGLGTADRKNMVFTGTTVTYGRGRAVVTATAMDTAFGRIARDVAAVKTEKTPLERRTEEIGKWLGIVAVAICALVAGISIWREYGTGVVDLKFIVTVTMFAVALAVAAVPEALAAIVTGALAIGMREMAKKNALVRKMPAVETLGCTTVICTDKTGTLTRGEMTVRRIVLPGGDVALTGGGYAPAGELRGPAGTIAPGKLPPDLEAFLRAALLCNDASLAEIEGKWSIRGDPTEAALVVAAAKAGFSPDGIRRASPRADELPFSSERKRMTTLHALPGGGLEAFMKGAPEVVLARCSRILEGDVARELTAADRAAILAKNAELAAQALRVLGLAATTLAHGAPADEDAVERDMVFLGLAGMMDPPRPEAAQAVAVCRKVGIRPVMITGDHALTATAVAREIGIWHEGDAVMTGEELAALSESEFAALVASVSVYARVSPTDKLTIVKAWKARGEVVAMTGDGVNDAPALKHADIGVAMGISGTEVAKEAADMVLTDDNFATIVTAIEQGRWIYDNIKKYLAFLIQCNLTEVAVIGGVVLALGPEYLPLLPAAILYINLATDGLPALALGVAPPDPDIMERPPRDPRESVFSKDVVAFILRALVIEIPFFFLLFFHDLGDITHARTEIFFLFIIVEVVIALNCRSLRYSIFAAPPHKWLLAAVAWELVLIVALMQFATVREAFGITMPSFSDLTVICLFSALIFAVMELTKYLLRRNGQKTR